MTLALGSLIGLERMTWRKLAAVAVALAGIAVALGDEVAGVAPDAWRGDLLMALAALFCAIYVLFARGYVARYGGLRLTAVKMSIGSALMVPLALALGDPLGGSLAFDWLGWTLLLVLAIPGAALMVFIYISAINMTTPTGITTTVGFNPLSAIVLGALVLDEPVTWRILAGFACITCAVILANTGREGPPPGRTARPG